LSFVICHDLSFVIFQFGDGLEAPFPQWQMENDK